MIVCLCAARSGLLHSFESLAFACGSHHVGVPGVQVAEGSTIIDLTGRDPQLLRAGRGAADIFLPDPVYA